jgi:S1-C subfamily serine protease
MIKISKSFALAAALSVCAGAGWSQTTPTASTATPDQASSVAPDQVLTRYTFRNVAKKVTPSVVNIKIKSNIVLGNNMPQIPQGSGLDKEMRDYLARLFDSEGWNRSPNYEKDYRYARSGSGVLVRPDGYIVTSEHVVRDVDDGDFEISMPDGRTFSNVEIVGTDTLTYLEVLKVNDAGT